MTVPTTYMSLLIHLDAARIENNEWVKLNDEYPYHWRSSLMKAGLIERRGNTTKTEYRITEAGTLAIMEGRMPVVTTENELVVIPSMSDGIRPDTLSTALAEPVDESERCCDCTEGCVYREVVELLAARNPKIRELIEAMQTVERLRGEL